ncbi:hypothetical protein SNARM312S_07548 [Streptomyces narbonensis]
MVEAVVQRDQCEPTRTGGQFEVPYVGARDDLVGEERGGALQKLGGGAHLPSQWGFSQMTVAPMPKPTHMVLRP